MLLRAFVVITIVDVVVIAVAHNAAVALGVVWVVERLLSMPSLPLSLLLLLV